MKLDEFGVGKITAQNTTQDVKPGQTEKEAKKFFGGNGKPKLLHKTAAKNSDPNTLMNLGIGESVETLPLLERSMLDKVLQSIAPKMKPQQYEKAAQVLHDVLVRKSREGSLRHSLGYYAQRVGRSFAGIDYRALADYYAETYGTEGITEAEEVIPMLYHATYKPFLDSIMKNGLGGKGAQTQWEDSKPGYVYLAKDPEVAVSHAEANEEVSDEYIDNIVVLSIDASQLDQDNLEDDPNVMDDDSTLAYKGIIPTSAFSIMEANTPRMAPGATLVSRPHMTGLEDPNAPAPKGELKIVTKAYRDMYNKALDKQNRADQIGGAGASTITKMKPKTFSKDLLPSGLPNKKPRPVTELRIEKPDPKDTLGVKRKEMPQIKTADYPEFIEYLENNGARFRSETIPAADLKAMQKEFSDAGILKQLEKNLRDGPNTKAVIASSDDYILDGHHRWLVALNTGSDLNVYRVNMPAWKLYDLVNDFEKTYYKDIYDEGAPSIGVPMASGLVVSIFPHRPLKIKKSTPGKLNYDESAVQDEPSPEEKRSQELRYNRWKREQLKRDIQQMKDEYKRKYPKMNQDPPGGIWMDREEYEKRKQRFRKSVDDPDAPFALTMREDLTQADINQLEVFADKLFAKVGIDVEFTRHFLDRVNDERNKKPITMAELTRLFKQEFKRYGKPIAQMGPGQEAVMKDLQTDINLPFALQYDRANNELDLIAKTVMRKKDFKTPDREFPVEGWSAKYKSSINCSDPKGFSQKAHCAGKKKNEDDSLGSQINFPGFDKKPKEKDKKPKYPKVKGKDKSILDKIKGWFTTEELDEDLRDWFKQKWVNIGKKGKDGKHPPCGTSGKKKGYAKCVPAAKAKKMSKKEKASATRRKRAAQNKAGRGGKNKPGSGKKPIRVSTKARKKKSESVNEAYLLQLENTPDQLVLHIKDTKTGERTEVRGKPRYETDYDSDDKLHQLLDVIGKASNISELMNGEVVNVNPKHPDGPKSYAKLDDVMDEDVDLQEGVNDPHIFKAVFLAGGPGSGKSFVANNLLGGTGLRTVNSDDVYEYMMQKQGLDLDPDTIASPQGQEIRNNAKTLTDNRLHTYLKGRIGLVIDGTGKDVAKYQKQFEKLGALGYDSMMIFVNTSEDVAQQRNSERKRSIPANMVTKMWNTVQNNLMKFQQVFGASRFHIIDNSGGLEDLDRKDNFDKVYNETQRFLNTPPNRRSAQRWIQQQQKARTDATQRQQQQQTTSSNGATENNN